MKKEVNSIYNTFKGGYHLRELDVNGEPSNKWQYVCCYGIIRFCKGNVNGKMKIPGQTYSLHINTWTPYCRLPEWMQRRAYNFHIAFIKQFPFVVFGFNNVSKYVDFSYYAYDKQRLRN